MRVWFVKNDGPRPSFIYHIQIKGFLRTLRNYQRLKSLSRFYIRFNNCFELGFHLFRHALFFFTGYGIEIGKKMTRNYQETLSRMDSPW